MKDFIEYVMSFYGPGEIYDMGATREEVKEAVLVRLENTELPFDGDSVDRELVRDIILEKRG
jgi:hypothetical protein